MKRVLIILVLLIMTTVQSTYAQSDNQPLIALVGGMLLDGYENSRIHNSVVIFQGNKIIAAGSADEVDIPSHAKIIDTRGKTVMPGLIDMHAHIELIGHGDYKEYYEFIGGSAGLGPSREISAKHLLRAGVTTALDLGSTYGVLDTRKRINAGEIPGPRLLASGPWISRAPVDIVTPDMQFIISSPEQAAARTNELIDRGVDVIKAWVGLTAEDYQAIVTTAHKRGIKVHAHVYDPAKVRLAIDAGVDVLQHLGSARNPAYSDKLIAEIAHKNIPVIQTIAHRIWIYPATVNFPARLQDYALRQDIPEPLYNDMQRSFKHFQRNDYFRRIGRETRAAKLAAKQLIEANLFLGVGTDSGTPMNFHTESMWREMQALVESGMSNTQVITAATQINAEILGNLQLLGGSRAFGTIEPGLIADIIVVDGDPLFDINALGHVDITISGGKIWYFDESNNDDDLHQIGKRF